MAQQLIVGLIVAAAALYVLWRYLPGRWRLGLRRVHPGLAAAPGCGGGDGGCSSCGSCAASPGPQAAEKPVALPPSRRRGQT